MSAFSLELPGWDCPCCGTFNGEAKEERSECRACGVTVEKARYAVHARSDAKPTGDLLPSWVKWQEHLREQDAKRESFMARGGR